MFNRLNQEKIKIVPHSTLQIQLNANTTRAFFSHTISNYATVNNAAEGKTVKSREIDVKIAEITLVIAV